MTPLFARSSLLCRVFGVRRTVLPIAINYSTLHGSPLFSSSTLSHALVVVAAAAAVILCRRRRCIVVIVHRRIVVVVVCFAVDC